MRLKSEVWVKAYLRSAAVAGSPGVVARRGDADAGVIFVKVARLDGTADLYGPAPAGLEAGDGERRWSPIVTSEAEDKVEARLASEIRLDSDIWIVEVEDRQGRHHLGDWLVAS